VGRDFIKLGDAVLATDPLSASGVQRAMQGALAAAVTVNTILRRPDSARLAEDFYRERQADIAQPEMVDSSARFASLSILMDGKMDLRVAWKLARSVRISQIF
jgi:flavin-dependent dehydrogenase